MLVVVLANMRAAAMAGRLDFSFGVGHALLALDVLLDLDLVVFGHAGDDQQHTLVLEHDLEQQIGQGAQPAPGGLVHWLLLVPDAGPAQEAAAGLWLRFRLYAQLQGAGLQELPD